MTGPNTENQGTPGLRATMARMAKRAVGATALDGNVFREVATDVGANIEAMAIVTLVAVATGVGTIVDEGFIGLIAAIVLSYVGWIVWTALTYVVGTKLLAEDPHLDVKWSQLARVLAFAQTPGLLRVLSFVPTVGVVIVLISLVWQFFAMAVAIRHTLNYASYWRALGVMAIAFIPYVVVVGIVALLLTGQR